MLYLYGPFLFLLYRPPCKVDVSLGLLIKYVYHRDDFSSLLHFYSLYKCFFFPSLNKKSFLLDLTSVPLDYIASM